MKRSNIIIICFLLTIVLSAFLLYPKYQDFVVLKKQIKAKENQLESKQEYLSNLSQNSEELKKYQEKLLVIDTALPSFLSLPSLFNLLQKTASQNGLIIKHMDSSRVTNPEGIQEVKVDLKAVGLYSGFKSFISVLEKSARIIEIESFSFSTPEKEEIFDFILTIKTYSY
jgi:Tfp pilus assembly protein PilO